MISPEQFTSRDITNIVLSPSFGNAVCHAAGYTARTEQRTANDNTFTLTPHEAGFVVAQTGGKFKVSRIETVDLTHPTDFIHLPSGTPRGYSSLRNSLPYDLYGNVRPGLAMVCHTRPGKETVVAPTAQDLEAMERIEAQKPDHVQAIIFSKQRVALKGILLCRGHNPDFASIQQELDKDLTAKRLQEVMRLNGFALTTLEYNTQTHSYTRSNRFIKKQIESLFYPPTEKRGILRACLKAFSFSADSRT